MTCLMCVCPCPRRRGFCDVGHKWQLRQGSDGSRPVVTTAQHDQETGCTGGASCCGTLQVILLLRNEAKMQQSEWPNCALHRRDALQSIFDEVRLVDIMDSGDVAHLSLMKRPDLGVTLTKLHCWTLTHYNKCVFMDADTMVRKHRAKILVWLFGKSEFCSLSGC